MRSEATTRLREFAMTPFHAIAGKGIQYSYVTLNSSGRYRLRITIATGHRALNILHLGCSQIWKKLGAFYRNMKEYCITKECSVTITFERCIVI